MADEDEQGQQDQAQNDKAGLALNEEIKGQEFNSFTNVVFSLKAPSLFASPPM